MHNQFSDQTWTHPNLDRKQLCDDQLGESDSDLSNSLSITYQTVMHDHMPNNITLDNSNIQNEEKLALFIKLPKY
jgi:hypothetical protein